MARSGAEAGEAGRVMNCLKLGRRPAVPTMSDLKKVSVVGYSRSTVSGARSHLLNDAVI